MALLPLKRLAAGLAFIAVTFCGCAAITPVPDVSQAESSALAIEVTLKAPIGAFSRAPDQVYFVRIDDKDSAGRQIIPSNYSRSGRAYLLNARPGTYVAVAAVLVQGQAAGGASTRFTTYFSRELVEQTRVMVGEDAFIFMGTYAVQNAVGLDRTEGETNYGNVFLLRMMGDVRYRGVLLERKADEQARREFLRKAKEDLASSPWSGRLR